MAPHAGGRVHRLCRTVEGPAVSRTCLGRCSNGVIQNRGKLRENHRTKWRFLAGKIIELNGGLSGNICIFIYIYVYIYICVYIYIGIYVYIYIFFLDICTRPCQPPHGMGHIYWPHMRSSSSPPCGVVGVWHCPPPPPCGVVGVWYGMLGMYGVYGRSGMASLESMVCLVGIVCMA